MVSKRSNNYARSKKRRTGRQNGAQAYTPTSGDVPPPQKVDLVTRSIVPAPPSATLRFHQLAPVITLSASAATSVDVTYQFALNGLSGSSTPAALFDMYRIEAVRMTIRPNNNAIGIADPTLVRLCPLYWVIDYNDGVALGSTGTATTYENCAVLSPGESGSRTFQPKMLATVKSAAGTDYMSVAPQWLPCTSDDVLHYGAKVFVPQALAAQTLLQTWQVTFEYWITFRNVV